MDVVISRPETRGVRGGMILAGYRYSYPTQPPLTKGRSEAFSHCCT